MKAMILAAGRGARMGALTQDCPKALIKVGDNALINHHLERLAQAGVEEVIINTHHLAQCLHDELGDGSAYGLTIRYSHEAELLGTGGGIYQALSHFEAQPFIVLSADIWSDYPLSELPANLDHQDAFLVLVDNPPYHPEGDFSLEAGGAVGCTQSPFFNYAGIGVLHPRLFASVDPNQSVFELNHLLGPAVRDGRVQGTHYAGAWFNVGTPEQLAAANQYIRSL